MSSSPTDAASAPVPTTPSTPGAPRLRIAPSPTGDPHVGTAYMALFNRAYARQQGGKFLLRIEDTDRARFREDSEQQLYDTLHWLDLNWDEGPDVGGPHAPYRQSERLDTYRPYVEKLLADGNAYHCWCSPQRLAEMRERQQKLKQPTGYDRTCLGKTREERAQEPGFQETPVVRMRIPDDAPTSFEDLIRGTVSAPRPDDQVILKTDGFPTYHLAVVVDDHEMGITHVVRGEEWISSTPKHVLLHRWLGLTPPVFAHMPLLRDTDRSKISKRRNPAARLTWFREEGYLPEAVVNFLALLAYPPAKNAEGEDVEQFTFDEFVERFSGQAGATKAEVAQRAATQGGMAMGTNAAMPATICRPVCAEAPNIVFISGVSATIGTTAIAATTGASIPSAGRSQAASPARTAAGPAMRCCAGRGDASCASTT